MTLKSKQEQIDALQKLDQELTAEIENAGNGNCGKGKNCKAGCRSNALTPAEAEAMREIDRICEFWDSSLERVQATFKERAATYSNKDLEMTGYAFSNFGAKADFGPTELELLGILFYVQGKVARAISAMGRGRIPTEDTLDDLDVYALMARWRFRKIQEEATQQTQAAGDVGSLQPDGRI